MDTTICVALPSRQRRRHAPEFKARVIDACLQPGISIAAVALANGLNANFLRSWVKAHRAHHGLDVVASIDGRHSGLSAKRSAPTLVPVTVQPVSDKPFGTIELEIHRQQTVVQIRWPASEATACAHWLRDLLR